MVFIHVRESKEESKLAIRAFEQAIKSLTEKAKTGQEGKDYARFVEICTLLLPGVYDNETKLSFYKEAWELDKKYNDFETDLILNHFREKYPYLKQPGIKK